jgi:hypothetical protein
MPRANRLNDDDTSWDLEKSKHGNLPEDEDAFDRKYLEWQKRDWVEWLKRRLIFPFPVKRMEDEDDAYFTKVAKHQPFRLGHLMEVIGMDTEEDWRDGIIMNVKEGIKKGRVPLADIEVTSKKDKNFWPVREYVVWFANR